MAKDEKPVVATTNAVRKETGKPGFGKRVAKWFREMKSELKKVVWPGPKEVSKNTIVSIVVMVISAIAIWLFDELAQAIVKAIITLAG